MSLGGPENPLILRQFEGLNTHSAPEARPGGMRPTEARLLQNIDVTEGDLEVRKGHKRVKVARIDSTRPVIQVFRALKGSAGTRKTIVATRNKLWTLSGSATASISGSSVSLTSGHVPVMCSYQDAVYGTNGIDNYWTWPFSGKIASATSPSGKWKGVFAFEEKIVLWRDTTTRSKFAWSDEGLPTTWQTLHFAFYPVDRSSELMLAWPLNGEIILAGPERTGKTVGGLPPKAIVDIDTGVGCLSYYSAAQVNGWVYWVANGPRIIRTNGNIVDWEFAKNIDCSDIQTSTERMLRGVGYQDRYYILSYPSKSSGATFPNRQLVYDAIDNKWMGPHQGNRLSAVAEFRAPQDDGRLVGGSPSGYAAIYYSGSSDAGTRITGVWRGPIFSSPDPLYRATVDEYGIKAPFVTSGSATIKAYIDRKTTASTIGSAVSLAASGQAEGDRDTTTDSSRKIVMGPRKANPRQTFFDMQPELSLAQSSGRMRVSMFWMKFRQVKGH